MSNQPTTPISPKRGVQRLNLDPENERELGRGVHNLSVVAVAESAHKLSAEERAKLLKSLEAQMRIFHECEVD